MKYTGRITLAAAAAVTLAALTLPVESIAAPDYNVTENDSGQPVIRVDTKHEAVIACNLVWGHDQAEYGSCIAAVEATDWAK